MWTRPARPSAVPWLRDVRRRRPAAAEQPLRQRGVEAPGHRILHRRAVLGKERAHLERRGRARGYGPTTPRSSSLKAGPTASTASALASSTATQPGPLSTHSRVDDRPRGRCRGPTRCAARAPRRPGPSARSGGAAKASPFSVRRTGISPAAHSCTITSARFGVRRRRRARRGTCRASGARRTAARAPA